MVVSLSLLIQVHSGFSLFKLSVLDQIHHFFHVWLMLPAFTVYFSCVLLKFLLAFFILLFARHLSSFFRISLPTKALFSLFSLFSLLAHFFFSHCTSNSRYSTQINSIFFHFLICNSHIFTISFSSSLARIRSDSNPTANFSN